MKTINVNLYKFDELTEQGKDKAIERLYNINTMDGWWDFIYDDAKNIGIKINGFDLEPFPTIDGEFNVSASTVADKIILEHGKECDTYKLAQTFNKEWSALVEKYSDGVKKDVVTLESEHDFDNEANELEEEFKKDILNEYLSMLRKDYEYQTSKEAIIETINANDYDFTEEGKLS